MKENKISLKTKFDLFIKMISDFSTYKSKTEQTEIMFSIPKNMKTVLRQASHSVFFSKLLIKNENEKIEKKKRKKKENINRKKINKRRRRFS